MWPDYRIYSKERPYDNNVISLNIRINHIKLVVWMILIKNITGIVIRVKESQCNGRFSSGKGINAARIHPVLHQKTYNTLSYPVVTRITYKRTCCTSTRQRYNSIESRTPGIGTNRLLVLKDNVENSFAYSYYFSHKNRVF